ncbi:MAG: DUF502 domain-containing protein [Planctomycetota bacterium]|jgi:uncharacterized membrane protein
MAKKAPGRLRKAFFAGVATLLPTVLTIFILTFAWNFLSEKIATPITLQIESRLQTEWAKEHYWKKVWNLPDVLLDDEVLPADSQELQELLVSHPRGDIPFEERVRSHVPNWVGLILALVLVFFVGFLFKGYLGRQAIRLIESWILRIPLIKVIYPYAKQVTEFFFQEKKAIQYESCVAVEYPRKGIYSVGFVTSEGFRQISELTESTVVSIFIPSSPTPVTGYTILVPKETVHPLDMTVDEALRFTISGGVILPPRQVPPLSLKTRRLDPPPPEGETGVPTGEGEGTPAQGS